MRTFVIILLVALIVVAIARKPRPAINQDGIKNPLRLVELNQWLAEPETLTVATFNIQTGKSLEGNRDITKSARAIADADIAGVQEVYAQSWLNKLGVGKQQTDFLAQQGKFSNLFAATRYRWFRENRGNLTLSKLPISEWEIIMLPDMTGKSFRNMTISKLLWQNETITIINTHLHTGKGREQQLEVVLTEFAKHSRVILLGDFNSRADTPLLVNVLLDGSVNDAIAVAGLDTDNPDRIDWILTKGFTINEGRMIEKGISDHPYYEVNLSIENH